MLAIAIPNELFKFGIPLIGLFATFPLYIAINKSKSYKWAFVVCFTQAIVSHICSSFWLANFQGFAIFTLGASAVGTGFIQAALSLFFYFPILFERDKLKLENIANPNSSKIPFRIIWFAAVYTIWEWVKSTGFLGYPWGTLSMTAYKWSFLTNIVDITGPYGITFLFAFASALIGEGCLLLSNVNKFVSLKHSQSYENTFKAFSCLFLISICYGTFQYIKPRTPIKTMNAVLIQQNGDPWFKGEEQSIKISQRLSEEKINELSSHGKKCDLVVWSEAVLRKRFPNAKRYYEGFPYEESLSDFINRIDVPFIIGGPVIIDSETHKFGNSTLFFDRNGKFSGSYQKMHLVPFAELIPGVENEKIRKLMKKFVGFSYGWYPGKSVTLFEIPLSESNIDTRTYKTISISDENSKNPVEIPSKPKQTIKFSTPICFDDTAAEVCRAMFLCGSEVFVNVTNDAWSKTESAEIQHMVVAHYRAIEYRTTLARCTNAGYTVVITPNGKIIDELPLFKEDALACSIPIYKREITLYAKLGNWLPQLLSILVACSIIFTLSKKDDIVN